MSHERIPRASAPEVIRRMMDATTHAPITNSDIAWHVLALPMSTARWHEVPILKNGFDLRRYFEILCRVRPDAVVETGMQWGGSAVFFMDALKFLGMDRVPYIGVDLDCARLDPSVYEYEHPHIIVRRDCLAAETVETVTKYVDEYAPTRRTLVILDSVHSEKHVTEELKLYAPLVGPGGYLVVEDTDHAGRPVLSNYGPAAGEAVDAFLAPGGAGHGLFAPDSEIENLCGPYTNCPGAWLRRLS